jgi:hypothetical protein
MPNQIAPKCSDSLAAPWIGRSLTLPKPPFGAVIYPDPRPFALVVTKFDPICAKGRVADSRSPAIQLTHVLWANCPVGQGEDGGDWLWLESATPFVLKPDDMPGLEVVVETCRVTFGDECVCLELWCR